MDTRTRCQATTKAGLPCNSFAANGSPYCMAHDPAQAQALQEARAKGGLKSAKLRLLRGQRSKLETMPELVAFTGNVIQDVVDGELEPDVARVILYGVSIQRQLVEASDFEKRIEALEEKLQQDRSAHPQQPRGRMGKC